LYLAEKEILLSKIGLTLGLMKKLSSRKPATIDVPVLLGAIID